MIRLVFVFCGVLLAAVPSRATILQVKSGEVRYEVEVKTLGIGGSTIVGRNKGLIGKIQLAGDGRVQGGLVIPVVKFESNNTRRDRDVAKILRYKEYPAITFEIVEMTQDRIDQVLTDDSGEVPFKAKISVAGGSKIYDMTLKFERSGEHEIKCTTRVEAKFTDFGLDPPTFGLILKSAPDEITLSGDMLLTVSEE